MLVSTVIPTVGRPELPRAVESVLQQDLDPEAHEVIVVNDSGIPLARAAWMASTQVRVIATDRQERSIARNAGAAIARGRYLKFLDDDDFLLPGALRALVEVASTTGAGIVYGALQRVDDDGRHLSIDAPPIRGNVLVDLVAGETFNPGAMLIRADLFAHVGGFSPEYSVNEDRDLELRLALRHDFEHCAAVVVCIRIGSPQSTTDWGQFRAVSRRIREAALDRPETWARVWDSAGASSFLRGRAARAYGISLLLNLAAGSLSPAGRRLRPLIRLACTSSWRREFWLGLGLRTGRELPRPADESTRGARARAALSRGARGAA